MTEINVQKVISEFIPDEHGEIKEIGNKEGNSRVFSIGDNYILRIGGKENRYVIEHEFIKLAQKNGVKTPRLIAANEDLDKFPFAFSIQEKLAGDSLDKLSESTWPNIFIEVGTELAKLYTIKMEGFGPIDIDRFNQNKELVGGFATWRDFVRSLFTKRKTEVLKKIEAEKADNFRASKLTLDQIDKLVRIGEKASEIDEKITNANFDLNESRMLHGDLQRMNFIVSSNHLSGIIDFEHVLVGDPLFDISVASVMPDGELHKELLDKSGVKMDKDRFHLYRLLISFGKIYTRYVKKDYSHESSEILDFVLEELGK